MYELKKPVALVGMMGSGKSAVGKAVSSALSVPFNDADDEIEQAARLSIPEIFERHGEKFFRDKENQVVTRLLKGPPSILATGGGAFINKNIRREMTNQEKKLFGIEKLNVKRSNIPAVTHVDYSARIQTVHQETNPKYYKLIKNFENI